MKKIAVVGTGYVGLVSGTCFAEIGNRVICCDIDLEKITKLKQGIIPIYESKLEELVKRNLLNDRLIFSTNIVKAIQESEIIYIAVGTPMSETGDADLTYVRNVAKTIGENINSYKVVVNKSTVPVGTANMVKRIISEHNNTNYEVDVVSNPEFLREGSAVFDTMNMERAVIGATSEKAAKIIEELHAPFNTHVLITDVESAEMIKYASNAFLATKISFINDIANICEKVGADVTQVAKGMGLDSRIGSKFLQAGIGYGGSCFPKDTQALVHIAEKVNYDFKLIKAVIETNDFQRNKVIEKLQNVLGDVKDKTVAILGLAFKPNTDDMRYAPSLDIIPKLLNMGANIKAFDPIAIDVAKKELGTEIEYLHDVYETIHGSHAIIILTEWQEIINMDLSKVKELIKLPIIIDGRNCFDLNEMEAKGYIYHSIGRPVINAERATI